MAHKKSRMALGTVEYGDVYNRLCETNKDGHRVPVLRDNKFVRDQKIGRLIVDFGSDTFWFRPLRGTAQRITNDDVGSLVANDLIEFDDPNSRQDLLKYLVEYSKRADTLQEAEVKAAASKARASALTADTKLQKSVRRNTRIAKFTWTLAMIGLVLIAFAFTMPKQQAAPATATISGVGQELNVDSSVLQQASYIQALGNGTELYGILMNTKTKEVGDTSSGNAMITEDIAVNPSASGKAIHLRPLYYDKTSFYQTEIKPDPSGASKTAVYLQNPNGYALGVSANEVMIVTGDGFTSIPVLVPDAYQAQTASDAQSVIESNQNSTASERSTSRSSSSNTKDSSSGSTMPDGWLGADSASVGSNKLAASYWYTKDNSGLAADLHRRIAVADITDVLTQGPSAVSNMDIAQLNYQDKNSNYYAPCIAQDTDSKGSTYLLAYMKQDYNGNTGFFVRRIQSDTDVLVESYTNTFSTQDLTGSSDPITNYTLLGNRLFFEQDGYIWMMNLSENKLNVVVNGDQRTVSRENAIKLCSASDIYASITSDEQRAADETKTSVSPVAHYTPMTLTTDSGLEYGIVFVESDTGDLVFQPAVDMNTASNGVNSGTGSDSTANGVGSSDEAAIQELLNENQSNNQYNQNLNGTTVGIPSDIIGKPATDAIKELQALGFTVKTTGGTGSVISVSPTGSALYGSTVTLTLGQTQSSSQNNMQSSFAGNTEYQQTEYSLGASNGSSNSNNSTSSSSNAGTISVSDNNGSSNNAVNNSNNASGSIAMSVNGQNRHSSNNSSNANAANSNSSNANVNNGNANNANNGSNTNASVSNTNANAVSSVQATTDDGRIVIRDIQSDSASVVCFAVRGEQILWIDQDLDGTRHVKFSPIYYKDSRQVVEAYQESENVNSSLGNDNATNTTTTGIADSIVGTSSATPTGASNTDNNQQQQQAQQQNDQQQQQQDNKQQAQADSNGTQQSTAQQDATATQTQTDNNQQQQQQAQQTTVQ